MKSISTLAMALSLTVAGAIVAAPADAQKKKKNDVAQVDPNARKYDFSKAARPLITTLNTAVTAKDAAGYAAALAPAQAAATTADDKYAVAQLQLKYAIDTSNLPGQAAALEALAQSGGATPAELPKIYDNLGRFAYEAKDYAKAGSAFERLVALSPNDGEAIILLAEVRNRQGRTPEGIQLIDRAITAKAASGQKVPEDWYKRGVALSTDAKLAPLAVKLSREWLTAYNTQQNWRDALSTYRYLVPLDDSAELDRFRLTRAAGALQGERDYKSLANYLMSRSLFGEAKSVLDEGVRKNIISAAKPEYKTLIAQATSKSAADRPTLAGSEPKAQTSATGSIAIKVADAYMGYGDYAKAATFYRTALTKAGVDASLVNTRLGYALAMSGDKAGAAAAFNAVTGPRQDLARYWSLWLSQRA